MRSGHAPRPDLIVWPETSYPFGFIMVAPGLDPVVLKAQVSALTDDEMPSQQWLDKQKAVINDIRVMTDEAGVPMLVGSAVTDHQARPNAPVQHGDALPAEPAAYTFYHKMHLVPFGEFIPLIDVLPWLASLTPYRDKIPDLSFGREPRIFEVGPYRFAATDLFRGHHPPGHRPLLHRAGSGPSARLC